MADSNEITVVHGGQNRLPELEPLYKALQEHHNAVAPNLAGMPARAPGEAWARRRLRYARWLAMPDAFLLLAETAHGPVGFALVTLGEDYDGWLGDNRVGEIRDLAVLPELRRRGIGTKLLDAVEESLAAAGVRACRLNVLTSNVDAIRLYERRGMMPAMTVMLRLDSHQPNTPHD